MSISILNVWNWDEDLQNPKRFIFIELQFCTRNLKIKISKSNILCVTPIDLSACSVPLNMDSRSYALQLKAHTWPMVADILKIPDEMWTVDTDEQLSSIHCKSLPSFLLLIILCHWDINEEKISMNEHFHMNDQLCFDNPPTGPSFSKPEKRDIWRYERKGG